MKSEQQKLDNERLEYGRGGKKGNWQTNAEKCRKKKEIQIGDIEEFIRSGGAQGVKFPLSLFVFSCSQMEQPQSQTKCPSPPTHTDEGVLLTEKSAYSPESGFPGAPLHARSPQPA